jgi:hypothetical protein
LLLAVSVDDDVDVADPVTAAQPRAAPSVEPTAALGAGDDRAPKRAPQASTGDDVGDVFGRGTLLGPLSHGFDVLDRLLLLTKSKSRLQQLGLSMSNYPRAIDVNTPVIYFSSFFLFGDCKLRDNLKSRFAFQ